MEKQKYTYKPPSGLSSKKVFLLIGIPVVIGVAIISLLKMESFFYEKKQDLIANKVLTTEQKEKYKEQEIMNKQLSADVKSGVIIEYIQPDSIAEKGGLKRKDIITEYNGIKVRDTIEYGKAKDQFLNKTDVDKITLTFIREGKPITVSVAKGGIGIEINDWSPLMDSLFEMMYRKDFEQMKETIADAEKNNALSPAQLLIAKIITIKDKNSTSEDLKKIEECLQKLIESIDKEDSADVALDYFYTKGVYYPASVLFQHFLKFQQNPYVELNLSYCYAVLGKFEEAERLVESVMKKYQDNIADRGYHTALFTKGRIAIGRKDYQTARKHFDKAFEYSSNPKEDFACMSLLLVSSALTKKKELFEQSHAKCKELGNKEFDKRISPYVDSLEAYIIVENNPEAALQIAKKWIDNIPMRGKIGKHWDFLLEAEPIVENWEKLIEGLKNKS
ncbi:MAG: PDZ domain-containing protein [Blastocatellia bacterium]